MIETDDMKFRRVIEKAWADPTFRKQLVSDPEKILKGEGIEPPPGAKIEVITSSPKKRYFVIPPAPDPKLTPQEIQDKSQASDYRALVHLLYDINCC